VAIDKYGIGLEKQDQPPRYTKLRKPLINKDLLNLDMKFKRADRMTPDYELEILPHTMKDMHGEPVYFQFAYQTITQQLGGTSRRKGATLCYLSEDYRKLALR
jgi:hypothetical protein